ncbi:LacI family DNA-binding transcriptional regulator [soil metagenome]
MTGNATLYDVARAAGVSLAKASRSLNGSARKVNEEYRQRVLAAAEQLGYTANASAQAVARGSSATVALLVSDIADPYFSAIAAGVIRAAEEQGLNVTMAVTERDAARELDLVRLLRGQRPRAIVLAGSRFTDGSGDDALAAELDAFTASGGRVVLISRHQLSFDTVAIDNTGGAAALAASLVDLGYRGFAVLAGPADLVTAQDRAAAFTAALPSAPLAVVHGAFSRDAGYEGMLELIDSGLDAVDLVFAVNDVMAIGALAALRDRGIDVPGRIAVAGYDDISTARDVTPALTTVRVDLESAGAAAVALALGDGGAVQIGAEVVLRASTPRR